MSTSTTSPAGWHDRAQPLPSTFTPTRSSLALAVLRNAQADPNGFTLALFSPTIAVDATGSVLQLIREDYDALVNLARQTLGLPPTGSFMNTWRVKQERTSQPIERLLVPRDSEGELVQTSVQGYEKGKTELSEPVDGIAQLPDVLQELIGLVEEARKGYVRGEEDRATIEKVKNVLGDEFSGM